MNKKLIIIGASGHGKVVADIAVKIQKYDTILFLDDDENIKDCLEFPVVGKTADAEKYLGEADFFVAIGHTDMRRRIVDELERLQANITTLIHPMATVGRNVEIGVGTVIMAGAVINSDTIIGKQCIINTCASVDHDCRISDYVHIAVGAHVCGTIHIGKSTWIGAGATVINNTNICSDCLIGAGAVVEKNIEDTGTYIGIPARKVKE